MRALLALVLALGAPAAGRLHVVLKGQDHFPVVGKAWHYELRATDARTGRPVACTIHLQFIYMDVPVGQIGRHALKRCAWQETLRPTAIPPQARSRRLTVQAIVTAKGYAGATAEWRIVPR